MALVPALAGLASVGTAVIPKGNKRTQARRQRPKRSTAVVLYNPQFAKRQMQKQRTARPRPRRRNGGTLAMTTQALQPTFFGSGNSFDFAGPANRMADIDNRASLKIRGSGLVGSTNANALGNTIGTILTSTALTTSGTGAVGHSKTIGVGELDPRVGVIASVFSHYAIRRLELHYVPSVSQYNYGATYTGNIGLCLTDEVDSWNGVTMTLPQTQDFPCKAFGPLYQPLSVVYTHNGSRTWYTSTSGTGDFGESYQLIVELTTGGPLPTLASAVGNWWASWELDLYRPSPQITGEDLKQRVPPSVLDNAPGYDRKDFKTSLGEAPAKYDSEVKESKGKKSYAAAPSVPPLTRVGSSDSVALDVKPEPSRETHFPAPPGGLKVTRSKA